MVGHGRSELDRRGRCDAARPRKEPAVESFGRTKIAGQYYDRIRCAREGETLACANKALTGCVRIDCVAERVIAAAAASSGSGEATTEESGFKAGLSTFGPVK